MIIIEKQHPFYTRLTNSIQDWKITLQGDKNKFKNSTIYTFESVFTENFFEADGYLFSQSKNKGFDEIVDLARKYWGGEKTENYQNEILFCRKLRTIKHEELLQNT